MSVTNDPPEYADIIFHGVWTHHLEGDKELNIIEMIEEKELEELYSLYSGLFERRKNYSWPVRYDAPEEMFKQMRERNIRGFQIFANSGLDGFVFAEKVDIVLREHRKDLS
jgi:hypothetical protein